MKYSYETDGFGLFFMNFHEKIVQNRMKRPLWPTFHEFSWKNHTKSYETAVTAYFSWIFMKKSYEIVRNGRYGLLFMNFHEKFVRNRTKRPKRPIFHEFSWKFCTKSYETAGTAYFSWIFMKITYEIVRNGRNGLVFMTKRLVGPDDLKRSWDFPIVEKFIRKTSISKLV